MVANAGICLAKPFLECEGSPSGVRIPTLPSTQPGFIATLEDWDQCFNVNGKGVFLCYKYAAQRMIEQGRGGRIIGASSKAGKQGKGARSILRRHHFNYKPRQRLVVDLFRHQVYCAIIDPKCR